jgi:hypothetical protein
MSLLQNCPTQAASEKSWPLRPGSLGRPGVFARLPRNKSFTLNTGLGQGDGRPRTGHHLIRTVLRTVVFLGDGGGVRQAILQPVVGPTMWPACWPPVWTGLPSQRPCSRHRSMASLNALQLRGCDFDGCGAVVADFSMLGAFDGPVAGAVAFDDAGVGAVAAFPVGVGEDFLDDAAARVIGLVRGERPRSRRLRGGSRVGIG